MAKKPDAAASDTVRLTVRTAPIQGELPRYRAGLGPFGRDPVEVECAPWQADALRADPALVVSEAE